MITSRKKRPLRREMGVLRDTRLIVIATEGSKTEAHYFKIFGGTRVQVVVIQSEDGKSSPQHVLDNLKRYTEKYQIAADDEFWVAIDLDRWTSRSLSQVSTQCHLASFNFAVSNPCFELWLALHFEAELPAKVNARSLSKYLKKQIGSYSKSSFNTEIFAGKVIRAVEAAKKLDVRPSDRWPQSVGSRVYRIVEAVLNIGK